jgi:hypothetical protein
MVRIVPSSLQGILEECGLENLKITQVFFVEHEAIFSNVDENGSSELSSYASSWRSKLASSLDVG